MILRQMERMDEGNTRQHGDSGLTARVLESEIPAREAEVATLEFLREWVDAGSEAGVRLATRDAMVSLCGLSGLDVAAVDGVTFVLDGSHGVETVVGVDRQEIGDQLLGGKRHVLPIHIMKRKIGGTNLSKQTTMCLVLGKETRE